MLDASLLTRPSPVPTRPIQGNVTAEEKILFLESWLNDSLVMNRELHNQLNLVIDKISCK